LESDVLGTLILNKLRGGIKVGSFLSIVYMLLLLEHFSFF
jgi:hypothetical protein